MTYDARCPACGHREEISKPMTAPMPACSICGAQLQRVYTAAAPVHYRAAGFYSTETSLDRQLTPERAAKFRAEKADIEKRAKAGRLTAYEKALEAA